MKYTGEDNLEVMKNAVFYNTFLTKIITDEIQSSDQLIVDFGAGNGNMAKLIERKIQKKVMCLEPSENMRKYYNIAPASSISDFKKESIDFLYSICVFEHIEDEKSVLQDIKSSLKKNGTLFLYLPAFNCLYSSMDKKVGHYRRYTKKMLYLLFPEDEWQIKNMQYADFLGFFVTLLFKLIGNKRGTISKISIFIFDRFIFPFSRIIDKITAGKILGKNIFICAKKRG